MIDGFDADVVIYAATDLPIGARVRSLLARPSPPGEPLGTTNVGSVLLYPEVLAKPLRQRDEDEYAALDGILSALRLLPTTTAVAELATVLAATYRLKAVDAIHLATAIDAGADRFITNNRRDFTGRITEIEIVYPDDLDEPGP